MNVECKTLGADEINIDIIALVKICLKKVWLIFGVAILTAVIICSFIYYKDMKDYNFINEGLNINENQEIDFDFSEKEQQEIDTYFFLNNKLTQLQEYEENATILELDFSNVYQGTVQYYINCNEEVKLDIAYAIANYINNGSLVVAFEDNANLTKVKYMQELIKIELSTHTSDSTSGIFMVKIFGDSKETCEAYIKEIKYLLEEYSNSLDSTIAENDLIVLQEDYVITYRNDIYEIQKNHIVELNTIENEIKNHINTLTEMQKVYILSKDPKGILAQDVMKLTKPSFSIKYAVIGTVLGMVLVIGVICVTKIFDGTIKSTREIFYRLKVNELGSICTTKEKNEEVLNLADKIILRLKNEQIESVVFIGTTEKILGMTIAKLKETIEASGIKVRIAGDILSQVSALEHVIENRNVVLVEEVGKTKVAEIYEEMQICSEINAKVIGYFSVTDIF